MVTVFNLIPELTAQLLWKLQIVTTVLAQHIDDPNILGKMQQSYNHFIQTGQVWALLVGLIMGYLLRGLSTYG